jgi:hypothetical protein
MTIKNAEIFCANDSLFEVRCSPDARSGGRKNEEVSAKKIKFLVLIYFALILSPKNFSNFPFLAVTTPRGW